MALFLRHQECKPENRDWREAFLYSAVIWAALAFAFTELLSLFSALTSLFLALCWGFVALVLLFILLRFSSGPALNMPARFWWTAKELSRGVKALLFWIALSLAVTGLIAVVAPPNNFDSMTYHMSRVAHWWADKTIAFYPTNIQRQLFANPLAEYMTLQFFVLSGGSDRLVNLVQWFSFGGCAIAVSLLARRLGENRFTQCAAAFVVVTTPMCILEATSTQNDLTCAFLTVTTIYFLYCGRTVLTGISLGLAILVKFPAGVFVLPFLLLLLLRKPLHPRGILRKAGKLFAIGGIAIALNTPHALRNIHTFRSPLGEKLQVQLLTSQTSAFRPFVANVIRNLGSELGTPISLVNKIEDRGIRIVCRSLRLDLDDPRNTYYQQPFAVGRMTGDEDSSANPLPTALFIAATVFFLASRRLRNSNVARFAALAWAGFLLIAWRISWEPWITRILIPFLVLSSLPNAVLLNEICRRSRIFAVAIFAVVAFLSLQPLLHNLHRPFLIYRPQSVQSVFTEPRADEYFKKRPEVRSCYKTTIQSIFATSCHVVGIKMGENQMEYPFWALANSSGPPTYFEHIDVNNQTKSAQAGFPGTVCARITVYGGGWFDPLPGPQWIELHKLGPNGEDMVSRFDCK